MAKKLYTIGDQPVITFTFYTNDNELLSPTAIDFTVVDPAGAETAQTIGDANETSEGTFDWTLPSVLDSQGIWYARAAATSGLVAAVEVSFRVRASQFD